MSAGPDDGVTLYLVASVHSDTAKVVACRPPLYLQWFFFAAILALALRTA